VLNKGIQERNEEIQAQSEELIQSNRTIHELNEHLEKMVEDKTLNLKKTNEELIRSNNNLQQFSYVISHNLRGPIARLLGLTSILKTLPPGEEQTKFLELTHQSSTDLDTIVYDLSKIINLKGGMNSREPVDLQAEFEIAMQQNAIPENYRNCVQGNFTEIPQVHSVKAFIQSIFYNLLSNAYKYRSPERALSISVNARKLNDTVEITVSDNGLGIDLTKHRDSVFKLFKRFHLNADGRGLGLYLVKEQVEALGGTIDIQSQPDVGTTFIIRHPV
jgi:signal transduction histidine kinase